MRVCADRSGKFSDGNDIACAFQALECAFEFIVHEREFQPKRRWFTVDAMAAADAWSHLMLVCPTGDDGKQFLDISNEDVRALHHLYCKRRVHDIARGKPEMKPTAGGVVDLF